MRILVCLFFLLSVFDSFASKQKLLSKQNPIDSLVKILNYPKNDSLRDYELNKVSFLLKNTNPILIFDTLRKTNDYTKLSYFSIELSKIFDRNNNLNKSIIYAQYGLLYADSASSVNQKKESLNILYKLYNKSGNYLMALNTYKTFSEFNDSIAFSTFNDSILSLKLKFEDQKLTNASLYKSDIDAVEKKYKSQSEFLTFIYFFIAALLLLTLFFILNKSQIKKKYLQQTNESNILLNDEKQKVIYFEKKLKETEHTLSQLKSESDKKQLDDIVLKDKLTIIQKPKDASIYTVNESALSKVGVTDMTDLIKFTGNNKLIICNYLELFLNRIPQLSHNLETDLQAGNLQGIKETTSSMKHLVFQVLSSKYKSLVLNVTKSIESDEKIRPAMISDFIKICKLAVGEVQLILSE
jgi:hypothetical protein